jgi:hypothetical protein
MENNMEYDRDNTNAADVLEWEWKSSGSYYDTAVAPGAAQSGGALTISFEDYDFEHEDDDARVSYLQDLGYGALATLAVDSIELDTSAFAQAAGSNINSIMTTAGDVIAAFFKQEPELDVMFHINISLLQQMVQVLNKSGLKTTVDKTYYYGDGEQPIVFVWNPAK